MTPPDEFECRGNDEPVCPYCGAEQGDFWEVTDNSGDTECGTCGRPFFYEREYSVTYDTSPIMGPHQQDPCYQESEQEHLHEREQEQSSQRRRRGY